MVLHSCAGAANKGIMATVVSGSVDELILELYAAHVGIIGFSERDRASDCATDHAKSSCAAASVMSGDELVSNRQYLGHFGWALAGTWHGKSSVAGMEFDGRDLDLAILLRSKVISGE